MVNFFKTALGIEFEESSFDTLKHKQEFLNLNANFATNKFKKLAQKIEFSEGEELLFQMLLSIQEDIARLERKTQHHFLKLEHKDIVCGLHYEYIQFLDFALKQGTLYYARLDLNNQKIALFLEALSSKNAKIVKIKNEDKNLYDIFVAQTQRNIIKEMKGKDNE